MMSAEIIQNIFVQKSQEEKSQKKLQLKKIDDFRQCNKKIGEQMDNSQKIQVEEKNNETKNLDKNYNYQQSQNKIRKSSLFNHQIFQNDYQGKKEVIDFIQQYQDQKIKQSKLLYRYHPQNKTNFHKYIDNKKGLLIVIKTKYTTLAVFYKGELKENEVMDQGGILISVDHRMCYRPLNPENKLFNKFMCYDPYYLVIGNSDLRLKISQKQVFSNIGCRNRFFDWRGNKAECLFNQGQQRYTKFQSLEIHQVIFEKQQQKGQLKFKINEKIQLKRQLKMRSFFCYDIFQDNLMGKRILVNAIQQYMHKPIQKCKLLYKFDPFDKPNLHNYIDNLKGLLFLIKTKHYATIGCFYPGTYRDKIKLDEGGLIVSVDNNQSYPYCQNILRNRHYEQIPYYQNSKYEPAMIYDPFWILFGRKQIALIWNRHPERSIGLFSNFGCIKNFCYDSKGKRFDSLFSQGDKLQVEVKQCECYQIVFAEQTQMLE